MRPAYEQIVEALKKDLNRAVSYEYREIVDKLIELGTEEEKKYLLEQYNNLMYEHTEVQLSKLILGINDNVGMKVLDPSRHYETTKANPVFPLPRKAEPYQMELDL